MKEDWEYFLDGDGIPMEIGGGDVLAIIETIGDDTSAYAAYAQGWNDARIAILKVLEKDE